MAKKKIAVIGIGKISQDQHLPVIDKSKDFEVAATVSGRGVQHRGLPVFKTAAELYKAMPEIKLVAICTPPGVRHAYVREALDAGKHVLMEKPPTPTISELDDLVSYAKKKKRILFQTWHSRYNEAVDAAKKILKKDGLKSARIDWRESVRTSNSPATARLRSMPRSSSNQLSGTSLCSAPASTGSRSPARFGPSR